MSNLLTDHPIALNALFDETLFSDGFSLEHSAQEMQKGGFESAKSQLFTKETNSSTAEVVEEFIYTGSLAKGVLFILRYPEFEYFSDGARDAFQKSLAAVGLKEEDVEIGRAHV